MISEDVYSQMLAYSKEVFKKIIVNPMDMVHDIICDPAIISEGKIDEKRFASLFLKKKRDFINSTISNQSRLHADGGNTYLKPSTIYKQCRCCGDILPEREYYKIMGNYRQLNCTICANKRDAGRKREAKERKPRKDYVRLTLQKDRLLVKDSYVKDILKKNGFAKEDITEAMIAEKRNSIIKKRSKIS